MPKQDKQYMQEWRKIYEAAQEIYKIAPWEWMEEIDVFGVQNPETDELGFVSVMGMLGEYYGIGVYLGTRAVNGFWAMQEAGPSEDPGALLELSQLQASFVGRKELEKDDLALIKQLGLKFRGKHAWPQFRSIRPAHMPWFLEPDEMHFLRYVLEQTIDVAVRFKEDEALLDPSDDDDSYLIRTPRYEGSRLIWEDQVQQVVPPEDEEIAISMDLDLLEKFKALPQSDHTLECDFFMMPAPVMEGERPFFPYILLVVEPKSEFVLGTEVLQPEPTLEAMWGLLAVNLVSQFVKAEIRPKEVKVKSELVYSLLEAVAHEAGFKLRRSRRLKGLEGAKTALFQHMLGFNPEDLM